MLHHIDVHVRDIQATKRFFDALAPAIGYRIRADYDEFVGYEPAKADVRAWDSSSIRNTVPGLMRLAFGVDSREAVDAAAKIASENGARNMDGPSLHPEYGDDYYAAFFEDADGNLYEIAAEPEAVRGRGARIWRGRVRKSFCRNTARYRVYGSRGLPEDARKSRRVHAYRAARGFWRE